MFASDYESATVVIEKYVDQYHPDTRITGLPAE